MKAERRLVVGGAAAVTAAMAVAATLIWLQVRGPSSGQAISVAVSGPSATSPEPDSPVTGPGTISPDTTGTSTSPPSSLDGGVTGADLLAVVLTADDRNAGPLITLDEITVESGSAGNHPLTEYDFCGTGPDLTTIGPGAKRATSDLDLTSPHIVVSTASLATSPEAAQAAIDAIVLGTDGCTDYTSKGGSPATITGVERTDDGAVVHVDAPSPLGPDVPVAIVFSARGAVVTTLELTGTSTDQDRLQAIVTQRAGTITP